MLSTLKKYFDEFRFIEINMERCEKTEMLAKIGQELNLNYKIEPEPVNYLNNFIENNVKDCLVVLGSIYILGTIKSQICFK
jgi:folylpolyglutamate synthase/dihydropteroate synthase